MKDIIGLCQADHQRVTQSVFEAEKHTDGEIVTIIADHSDDYRESGWRAAMLAGLIGFGVLQFTGLSALLYDALMGGGWNDPALADHADSHMLIAILGAILLFTIVFLLCGSLAVRIALTPKSVKRARVHEAAIRAFKIGAAGRTEAQTAVLIYLSEREHRAEIVGDEAINARIDKAQWARAMALLLENVQAGRAADGIIAAVENVGALLSAHFPKSDGDNNELLDRLIEL